METIQSPAEAVGFMGKIKEDALQAAYPGISGKALAVSHGAHVPLGAQAAAYGVCCSFFLCSFSVRQELGGFISTGFASASSYLREKRSCALVQARLRGQIAI